MPTMITLQPAPPRRNLQISDLIDGHEAQIFAALGITWPPSEGRAIHCPFPDHHDNKPSWRWDAHKRRYACSGADPVNGRHGGDMADVVRRCKPDGLGDGSLASIAKWLRELLARPIADEPVKRAAPVRQADAAVESDTLAKAAAVRARWLLDTSTEPDLAHPYVVAKQIVPYGARQKNATLLIPVRVMSGGILSVQRIWQEEGKFIKAFLKDGRVQGAFLIIGGGGQSSYIIFCEGGATGCSLHQATGLPVVVCFSAGGVASIAKAFRERCAMSTVGWGRAYKRRVNALARPVPSRSFNAALARKSMGIHVGEKGEAPAGGASFMGEKAKEPHPPRGALACARRRNRSLAIIAATSWLARAPERPGDAMSQNRIPFRCSSAATDFTRNRVAKRLTLIYATSIRRGSKPLCNKLGDEMAIYGYARVSTGEQDLTIQRDALKAAGCSIIREEKRSGTTRDGREEFETLLAFLQPGDTLCVTRIDRLARSNKDFQNIYADLVKRGVKLQCTEQPILNTEGALGSLMVNILAAFAEFETALRRERQMEGIQKAKANGIYAGKGRPQKIDRKEISRLKVEGMNPTQIARHLGINRVTVYRALGAGEGSCSIATSADA